MTGLAQDAAGNLYVADQQKTIRKVTPSGRVTTLAGMAGVAGSTDGAGSVARFGALAKLVLDGENNVYVADNANNSIRRITPQGVVSKFADLPKPYYLAFDSLGNLFAACDDHAIRKITPDGVVSVFAGDPGVRGLYPRFDGPSGLAIDEQDNVYVIDYGHHLLRKFNLSGAEAGTYSIQNCWGLAYDGHGKLYAIAPAAMLTLSLTGQVLSEKVVLHEAVDGPYASASFYEPNVLLPAKNGDVFIGDGPLLRRISNGMVTTIAGDLVIDRREIADGTLQTTAIGLASAAAYDRHGNLYIAEGYAIRKITPAGNVTAFASNFSSISGIAIDAQDNVYASDARKSVIWKISPAGVAQILAGKEWYDGFKNGQGTEALFYEPGGLAVDGSGNVYVADYRNHQIRKITPAGQVTTFTGDLIPGDVDGSLAAARFWGPWGLAFDGSGNLYVSEFDRPRVRKITPAGNVSTFAGSITRGTADGTGGAAQFGHPGALAVDATGIYVADDLKVVRKISFGRVVTTLAGLAGAVANVEGTGSIARFNRVEAIAANGSGTLTIGDSQNRVLYTARPPGIADTATASTTTPAMYSTVQLGTSTNTATKWEWSVLRRPAGSTAELSATNIRTPAFAPDVAGRFILLLRAENASGVRYSTVDLDPVDTCAPLSAAVVSMNGTASVCPSGTGGTASVETAGGGTLSYQWGWRATPDGETHSIPGATLSMYTLHGADFDGTGTKYLVVTVTSSCGSTITSAPQEVTVRTLLTNIAINAALPVYANNDAQTASVADAGFGAEYAWSITNGTILSGQGTRAIRFAAGASGEVVLQVTVTTSGCPDQGSLTMPVTTQGAMLYVITPCRVLDTRNTTILGASATREVQFGGVCGIPADAKNVAVNATAVTPSAAGWLSLYPADVPWPGISTLSYRTGRTRASASVIKLSADGKLMLMNGGPATHVILDVTGYFK